jgi:hypothetical protein
VNGWLTGSYANIKGHILAFYATPAAQPQHSDRRVAKELEARPGQSGAYYPPYQDDRSRFHRSASLSAERLAAPERIAAYTAMR